MRLSPETITILKNFSTISKGILISPGRLLKTRTTPLYAEARVQERFPIYAPLPDLAAVLKSLKFLKQPDFDFGKDALAVTESKEGLPKAHLRFEYDKSMVTLPMERNTFEEPAEYLEYSLSEEHLDALKKAVSEFGKANIKIASDGKTIYIGTDTAKTGFQFPVEGDPHGCVCKQVIDPKNLKLLPGPYRCKTNSIYTEFRHLELPVMYLVAREPKVSTFDGPSSRKRPEKPASKSLRMK